MFVPFNILFDSIKCLIYQVAGIYFNVMLILFFASKVTIHKNVKCSKKSYYMRKLRLFDLWMSNRKNMQKCKHFARLHCSKTDEWYFYNASSLNNVLAILISMHIPLAWQLMRPLENIYYMLFFQLADTEKKKL